MDLLRLMPRSCLEIMGYSWVQSHVPPTNVNVSDCHWRRPRTVLGASGSSTRASKIVPARNWSKLHCTTPTSRWWTPHWADEKTDQPELSCRFLLIQISRCLQIEKKCCSKHKRGKFTNTCTKQKKKSTREGNAPIPVPLDPVQPAMRALQLRVKKDGTLPTNPTYYFKFAVDTCWRANAQVSTTQL